ncbi:MAG: chorismate synthase [Lachnospiraceae bacterium]|nr:chorismate synthase [Lachnospiraceae bacterium]
MKNTFGNSISITLFGESHGEEIGVVLDGFAPGIEVDEAYIAQKLALRRPIGKISTGRVEPDHFRIVSGVFEGHTTGTPICVLIPNENVRSRDYESTRFLARPGHADYAAFCKYGGYEDYRGGGHFSGRLTAPLVAAGAIAQLALEKKGIRIGTHIARCAGIADRGFEHLESDIEALAGRAFAVLDESIGVKIQSAIEQAAADGDSVGGVLETAVTGLPAGVGEPWFDSLESALSHALFSIPALKGVEFGDGFAMADMRGSEANDGFAMSGDEAGDSSAARGGAIVTKTNHNGGINGGISNGMPILFRCAVKPTPSIYKEQDTVDFLRRQKEKLQISGRHDPAIVHRIRVVADSVTALVLCDMLALRYGTDYLREV